MTSRRAFLGGLALLPLAACAAPTTPPTTSSVPTTLPTTADPTTPRLLPTEPLRALERKFDARLGVYAVDTATGATLAHRADERFAFCSTFKALAAAAVLRGNPLSRLDTVVRYTEADLMASSFITKDNVETGMTIRALCDAAVRFSDGTAGNLLLREIGGPAALTAFTRSLGDRTTRMDRWEPDITSAVPGDPRDTSTPRALGSTFRDVLIGDALPEDKRALLRGLMERNTTGDRRIRAGANGWRVADKTGTGSHGTANDIGVVWPPGGAPLLVAIMSSRSARDADHDEALIAEAAGHAITALA
ncbi:class A beta-lactamase [Actinokineospora guangxiensis]|uniref:Beta-lactamase n=1 Tax=Actinokineospora guangxiensis TaxID=1490288 RepID=A0ABW0EUU2_9PSEU